jgi:hypothetical protein
MAGARLLQDFLAGDKAPYVVTLFVAAFTWVAHRTTDRLATVPFIEYRITSDENEKGVPGLTLRIRNLTEGTRFDCVLITLKPRAKDALAFGDPLQQRHRIRGTALTLMTAEVTKADEWAVRATNVAPGTDNSLFIPAHGNNAKPAAMVQQCTDVVEVSEGEPSAPSENKAEGRASGAVPVLIPWGFRTFFVEHELIILWSSLGAWLLLLLPSASGALRVRQERATDKKCECGGP